MNFPGLQHHAWQLVKMFFWGDFHFGKTTAEINRQC